MPRCGVLMLRSDAKLDMRCAGAVARRAIGKADPTARQAGTAQRLFSPVEAVKGFSMVESRALREPAPAAMPSDSAAPPVTAPSHRIVEQRTQQYSAVHAAAADDEVARPCVPSKHYGEGGLDSGHIIRTSSVFVEAAAGSGQAWGVPESPGKENDAPARSAALLLGSITKGVPQQMGSPFLVQNNPLSVMEPSSVVSPDVTVMLSTFHSFWCTAHY